MEHNDMKTAEDIFQMTKCFYAPQAIEQIKEHELELFKAGAMWAANSNRSRISDVTYSWIEFNTNTLTKLPL